MKKIACVAGLLIFAFSHSWSQAAPLPTTTKTIAVTHSWQDLKPGHVWMMKQSNLVLGDFQIYFDKSGVRADCPRAHVTFTAKAPDWNPVGYNLHSGKIWKPSKADFGPADALMRSLAFSGLPRVSVIPLSRRGQKNIHGFVCEDFASNEKWNKEQTGLLKQDLISTRHPRTADLQGADLHLPRPVCDILCKVHGVPIEPVVPLSCSYINFNHGVKTILVTGDVGLVAPPKNWLDLPPKLKTVRTYQELNMDSTTQAGLGDFFSEK